MTIHISTEQLSQLGLHRVAYLRTVSVDGETRFAIHGADGTALALVDELDQALAAIAENEMIRVTVH